jgi:hypothetical protein
MSFRYLPLVLVAVVMMTASFARATTWYVRSDGGTRYSAVKPLGQCNGQANAPYPGSGVNRACAFKDVRYLWADGEHTTTAGFPKWGWVGKGGDTYVIDCPTDCRVGYDGPNSGNYTNSAGSAVALAGNPYASGSPVPPSGTPSAHTRILGKNWQSCTGDSLKAHLNGGYGVSPVLNLAGASYVDVACFNITDHSSCTRITGANTCHTSYPLDDYTTIGIQWSNATTNVKLTDVRVHGMAADGMAGPTGNGVSLERVALVGNPMGGWNLDLGDGTTGTGTLSMDHMSILWSGCAEEYPIVDALPYNYCTDDQSGGYGDGIGTATVQSNPAWKISITNSEAAYNTQDGFDLLHVDGNGSAVQIQSSTAYSNMGQQLKIGASSSAINNLLIGNCNAMRNVIPGTPAGYNTHLSHFCRAANTAVALGVSDAVPTRFEHNTVLSDGSTGIDVFCNGTCTSAASFVYRNNIFYGFKASSGQYPGLIYNSVNGLFTNPGTVVTNNLTYHQRYACPDPSLYEKNAICSDPLLVDGTYHPYGDWDLSLSASSPAKGKGVAVSGVTADYMGNPRNNPPAIGAFEGTDW